ncbi:MAG: hypothetical protein KAR42_17685 [candidate division Zixibacteria bacterium]|nr:hypothetical protein [candidate division Zixibacteria bacterium]
MTKPSAECQKACGWVYVLDFDIWEKRDDDNNPQETWRIWFNECPYCKRKGEES